MCHFKSNSLSITCSSFFQVHDRSILTLDFRYGEGRAALYQLLSLGAEERVDSDDERCRGAEDFQELPGQDGDIREAEEEKEQ